VDPCCTLSALPTSARLAEDQGALQVNGKTNGYFYVFDEAGKQVAYESLNKTLPLDPGLYTVRVNNSSHPLEIESGKLATCSTGTLIVKGNTTDYYYVIDSLNKQLAFDKLGTPTSFFPSTLKVRVNSSEVPADIKINAVTDIETGTLVVHGTTGEYYYVLDASNRQLNYNALEKPLAFLPGTYFVKVNNTSSVAHIIGGQVTELGTGTLLVKGLTEEYYYVLDTLGNALNYQSLNKPLSFFPGSLKIKMNNSEITAKVFNGGQSELITGSIVLTGNGTDYYYVLDRSGTQLNYNSLNKSLSFFPSEYVVKLGGKSRKATVIPGQLTALPAF
jgi:hypothetical protein